ncbi:MAG TPA: hypothetical protein VKQ36_08810 [Ktedonobacterales bacterium]|nr:hypothetical protein [Ktedonobacterales bacterium]
MWITLGKTWGRQWIVGYPSTAGGHNSGEGLWAVWMRWLTSPHSSPARANSSPSFAGAINKKRRLTTG